MHPVPLIRFSLLVFLVHSRFDLILDNIGGDTERWALSLLKPWTGAKYVTLVTPFIQNTDSLGVSDGMVKNAATFASKVIKVIMGVLETVKQASPIKRKVLLMLLFVAFIFY